MGEKENKILISNNNAFLVIRSTATVGPRSKNLQYLDISSNK